MMNNVNENQNKNTQNYPSTMKKPIPISIVTGRDTIFIKTKPNKLTYNYINNGNQIKNNKILINSVNQSSEINKSLKNTFSLHKSNYTKSINVTSIAAKNLNTTKLSEIIKINKISNNNIHNNNTHYRGTNSFIKMNRRNNNNSINNNINNSSNHIFNFFTFINKINNNSSIKGKNKTKQKLDKKEIINRNSNKQNIFNYKDKTIQTNDNRTNSKGKRIHTSVNRTSYPKKYNFSNNLNIINKDFIPFRTIGYEKEYNYTIRGQFFVPGRKYKLENKKTKNNKYIYSIEKKKEKSLVEKRHEAKKPISYLAKNNVLNQKDKNKSIKSNKIIINLNNINNTNNTNNIYNNSDYTKEKDKNKNHRITSYNKPTYDFNKTNYKNKFDKIKNYETENTIKIKKGNNNNIFNKNGIDSNIKTSINKNKKIQITKNNFSRSNTIENKINSSNNIVNNNNYYSINNTFIFDTAGHKLIQYDLTKLIPTSKNNHSMNINISDISNYNSNISNTFYKTSKTIESNDNKNTNISKINKIENKVITRDNKLENDNKNDYISVVISNKNNKYNIQKYSSYKISNIIKNKINHNHLDVIANKEKFLISNKIKKESIRINNNNIKNKSQRFNNNNNLNNIISKDIIIKEYNNKKKKEIEKSKIILNNKDSSINKKNKFYEKKSKISIYNNDTSFYINALNRRKSDNISNYENKVKLSKYNINNIINSKKETANNSIQKDKKKITKDNKEKNKSNEKIKDINNHKKLKENKLISYKMMNFKKNKNNNIIININNSQKIKESKLKKLKTDEKSKNKKEEKGKSKEKENKNNQKNEIKGINNYEKINKIFFNEYEKDENNNENMSIDSFFNDNRVNKEKDNKDKNYTSFELISLSENRINEDINKFVDIPDNNELFLEDNFDDINSIIKKIDFYEVKNNKNDIFSINNNKYIEYSKKFDKIFEDLTSKINKK